MTERKTETPSKGILKCTLNLLICYFYILSGITGIIGIIGKIGISGIIGIIIPDRYKSFLPPCNFKSFVRARVSTGAKGA